MTYKVFTAALAVTVVLGVVQHLCCILGDGHHAPGMAAAKPCVRVALIKWEMEVDAPEGAEQDFARTLGRLWPGAMMHDARVLVEAGDPQSAFQAGKWFGSFELHDGGDFAPAPIEASLCGDCADLLLRITEAAQGWAPTSLTTHVELDVAAADSQAPADQANVIARGVLLGRGSGVPDGTVAVSALWWALAKDGQRRAVFAGQPLPPVGQGPWEIPFRVVEWRARPGPLSGLSRRFAASLATWQSTPDAWTWEVSELQMEREIEVDLLPVDHAGSWPLLP